MTNNVSNFGRYRWVKNLLTTNLVGLGYSPAEIRAAVLHAVHLLAQGNNTARAFSISSMHAARQRAAKLMLPF